MSESDEVRWSDALQARGADWVRAKLRERPGRPDDVVFDVVFVEPLPTRAFCQTWCARADNRVFHLSGHGKGVAILLIVLVAFLLRAVSSITDEPARPAQFASWGGGGSGVSGFSSQVDLTIPSEGSASTTTTTTRTSTLCEYITYATSRCPQQ